MDEFVKNILDLCKTFQLYGYVLATVSGIVLGAMLSLPSDKCHELARKLAPWVAIGLLVFMGSTSLGAWFAEQITFSS